MRKAIAAAGVLGLAVTVGMFSVQAYADRQLEQALDAWRAQLPEGTELSYGRIEAEGRDGAVLHAVRFQTDQTPEPVTVRAKRLEIDDAAFEGDMLQSVGRFDFTEATVVSGGSRMTIATGRGRDVTLAEDYRVRSVGRARLNDLDVEDARGTSSAQKVTLRGLGEGRLERLEVQALGVAQRARGADRDGAVRRVLVDRIRVRDADIDDLQRLHAKTDDPGLEALVTAVRGDGLRALQFDGLEMIEQGRRIAALESMDLSVETPAEGPITFKVDYRDGYSDVTHPDAGLSMMTLAALGYQEVRGDGGFTLSYHPEAGTFAIDRWEMDLRDVAQLNVTAQVVGIPLDGDLGARLEQDPQALQGEAALQALTVRLENKGLARRLAELRAQQTDQSPEAVRQQQAQSIRQSLQEMQLPDALGEAIARFVEQDGTLTLTAEPSEPVTFEQITQMAMDDPKLLSQSLNLQAVQSD
ncbi:hypothetical protein [Rhodovibrio salinarum]|nr:hypothetical protein [Rhodovibrio salinarum]